ncbi:MAG: sigma-54-dependent Fis family transcriptional regulator [Calditrichaeota bacterium]|nr:MAG: sigma-54-dependent Fis family transcriptional regulator [Calditrichota bacterium]
MPKSTILVIDDEPAILKVMAANLQREGYRVELAQSAEEGLRTLQEKQIDTIIVDYLMPGMTGLDFLAELNRRQLDIPVVVITAHGSIEHAVLAMQRGAVNYLTKPVNYDELISVVHKAVERQQLRNEVLRLRREVSSRYGFDQIVGQNHQMRRIFDLITEVADTDATVLIRGETGTGKELIARALHFNSPRKHRAFVRVNCAALSETLLESELFGHEKGAFTGAIRTRIGRFEQAEGGTMFFDEVGDIPPSIQAKLLRVLQEKEFERVGGNKTIQVDVRIIAATNKNLEEEVARGRFREDLFYRLNVIPIHLPPLRERLDDLPLLVSHFLKLYAEKFKKPVRDISPEALSRLMVHDWPGNVRELENVIERAVIIEKQEVITLPTIQRCLQPKSEASFRYFINEEVPLKTLKEEFLRQFEREYIIRLLRKCQGNIAEAARRAGMHYKNFYQKMQRYGISKWEFKE